jgi:membrane associated rhomboid family serine protease
MEVAPSRQLWLGMPVIPKSILAMSVPLYLGYFIKNLLLPRWALFVLYSWSIFSFLIVPALCLAECVVLAKRALRRGAAQKSEAQAHIIGVAVGLGAMLVTFLVRWYG